jgi:predicted ATP-dependent serine protease
MRTEQRLAEAEKLGYSHFATSQFAQKAVLASGTSLQVLAVSKLSDLFDSIIV